MNIFEQLQTIRINHFNQAQFPGTSPLSPRKGYFTITKTFYKQYGSQLLSAALINWKQAETDAFIAGLQFEVVLRSLFHNESTSIYKNCPIEDLVGKYIYIDNMGHVLEVQNKGMVKMNWGVIQKPLHFVTEQTAAIHVFFGSAKTLTEAWSNFEKTVGFDMADALEFEANGDDAAMNDYYHFEALGDSDYENDDPGIDDNFSTQESDI